MALLRRRPDLALPAPVDLATLANRIGVRTSIGRALDSIDAFTLRTLEVLCLLPTPAATEELAGWFAETDRGAVTEAVSRLRDWGLIWGTDEQLHPVGAVREVIGPYPAGLGRPLAQLYGLVGDLSMAGLLRRLELPPASQPTAGATAAAAVLDRLPALLADLGEPQRAVLDRLAAGPPIGSYRDPAGGVRELVERRTGAELPVRDLLDRGLVVPLDAATVELPREVALAVRTVPAGPVRPVPEPVPLVDRSPAVIDGGGATAVLETVRLVELLLHTLADEPAGQLRAGGVGVRDLRRLARVLDAPEPVAALLLEVAAEAGLLASSAVVDPNYLPTTEFDGWLEHGYAERWVPLAAAWLGMTRQPSLIGLKDERDKAIAALSADVERHSAPGLRRQLLRLLAELPPGAAPTDERAVLDRFGWQAPRRAATHRHAAGAVLAEAALLGITGYGALTGYGRALLDGAEQAAPRAEANAADALTAALPAPVEEFLLQPDLTVVVPGPPAPWLHRELALAADLESTGGAAVYRISPASLRRALDAGRTGTDLRQFFSTGSRTPMPQALGYLIGEAATQHGRLRVGAAGSYLRCDDERLLDRVLAEPGLESLGLHRIAPTVLVSSAGINQLLDRLRGYGFAPAAETADGSVLALAVDEARLPARRHSSRLSRVRTSTLTDAQLTEVVARLRASDKLAAAISNATTRVSQQIPGVTSASILELLRAAVREDLRIAIGYVDDTGTPSQHTLLPISVGGGMVRGHDPMDGRLRSFPLQRITTVSVLPDD